MPNISESKLDELADIFLIGTSIKDLPPAQQTQARNLTAEIFIVQQRHVNVTIQFANNVGIEPQDDGGAINAVSANSARPQSREMVLTSNRPGVRK